MATARNGDVELYWESFGDPADPTLLLINGLGSQCINYAQAWCERFVAEGYRVIRFDNRDVGLSSKLDGVDYAIQDMADDAVAVLDAAGVGAAHVMGASMGGMIAQQLAISHPDRVRTLTSVMSRTGEPGYGDASPEALKMLLRPPAASREEHLELQVQAIGVFGSKREWIDDDLVRERAAAAYDRCFCPEGMGRQVAAIVTGPSRDAELARLDVPTLVLHGSRDTLVHPSGGRHTAEVIPGARYVEIEGMGHDYPPPVWDTWVGTWAAFAGGAPGTSAT
jgi:pimeloyl-ACP methyl ester carboxylesterase